MAAPQSLSQDLAYLIDLAEQGRAAPPVGGRFALWWGVLTTLVLMVHWAIISGNIDGVGQPALPLVWLTYGVIGTIGTFVLDRSVCDLPGASAVNNRISGAIWGFMGLMTGLFAVGVLLGVVFGQAPLSTFDTILGVAFAGYAVAFFVSARLSKDGVSYLFSGVSALAVVVTGFFVGQTVLYLIAAGFVAATAIGSGLYQLSREPRTTV